jgi:hypothetical protein
MFPELTIDLQQSPDARWRLTATQRDQGRELLTLYKRDLTLQPAASEFLFAAAKDLIRTDHWEEMESLAGQHCLPVSDVVLCNLYYDLVKVVTGNVFGCTAFAVDAPGGVLHARNLDWWTENAALSRYTTINRFVGAPAGEFVTIGWPGFIGAFSGIAPGRFAVTLNAVLSLEPPRIAAPVVFLLRTVLEEARTFEEARAVLSETPIACDCLLLLTGSAPGELVVIERSPSRYALRQPHDGFVCVTNGYQKLEADSGRTSSGLLATWCERFERVKALVGGRRPETAADCFEYLGDPGVALDMTVQQMVFRAATGEYWMREPWSHDVP